MEIASLYSLIQSFIGKPSTNHPPQSVRSLYEFSKVCLGNFDQTILIRSFDVNNPVILFIHGGPGSPELPQAVKLSREIESRFTVVIWDQRGCGKSYTNENVVISKDQIVNDTIELIQYLKYQFKKDKIILIGHSWGTIISMNVICRIPKDILFYFSIGQVVDFKRNEEISYYHLLNIVKASNDKKSLNTLLEIGPPIDGLYKHNIASLMKQRNILLKYGCVYYGKRNANEIVKLIFNAPEYTLIEKLRYGRNQINTMRKIWNAELMKTNFISQAANISVPVCFFIGDSDFNTPKDLVVEYYDKISAPFKKLMIFEKSGHDPHVEETENLAKAIIEIFDEYRANKHLTIAST